MRCLQTCFDWVETITREQSRAQVLSFGNIESLILEQATNKAIVTVLQSKST